MKHLCKLFIAFGFIFSFIALAQDLIQVSLLGALEDDGTLVSVQEASEPQMVDGYDTTKDYSLEVQTYDGSVAPLRVWLAQDEGQTYAPFVSFGYYGAFDETGGEAFGYLYSFTAAMCLGIDETLRDEIGAFTYGFFPTVSEAWTSDTKQFGDYYVTVGGETEGTDVNLLVDIESVGTPGVNGWQITCGLE
jgi:hypothetical protein